MGAHVSEIQLFMAKFDHQAEGYKTAHGDTFKLGRTARNAMARGVRAFISLESLGRRRTVHGQKTPTRATHTRTRRSAGTLQIHVHMAAGYACNARKVYYIII